MSYSPLTLFGKGESFLKKVGIVSLKSEVADLLERELRQFLDGKVEFIQYIVTDRIGTIKCDADVVLLSGSAVAKYVYTPSGSSIPILSPRRTLTMNGWRKLKGISEGTSLLLVNDTQESAEEVVTLIKEFGLNLKIYPYYPGCKDFPKLDVAITPGEKKHVPSFVKRVIDIHDRIFDPSVILELLFRLDLFEWEDLQKLLEYSKTVKSTQPGLQSFLLDMATVRLDLETVLSMARQAVMAYSKDNGTVLLFNRFAEKYVKIQSSHIIGRSVTPILKKMGLRSIDKDLHNEIIELDGAEMVLNSKEVPKGTVMVSFYPVELYREVERKHIVKVRKSGMSAKANFSMIIGGDKIHEIVKLAKKIALSDIPVLLEGESGTGKELFAQAIHNYSKRSDGPFVPINCASLSEDLLESELFGYEEGAFTGAKRGGKSGLFEVANNGTIFLDEISEIPLMLQSKLLRVLQEKEIIKVGGTHIIPVNARVISATNADLFQMMEEGKFRRDLFYRISTFQLRLPSLYERIDDLEMLIEHFVNEKSYKISFDKSLMDALKKYQWPGNIREVENFVDYVGNLFSGEIGIHEIPPYLSRKLLKGADKKPSFEEIKVLRFIWLNQSAGRSKISSAYDIEESKVRKILSKLRVLGYVSVNRGRKGTTLTQLGYQLISSLNKEN